MADTNIIKLGNTDLNFKVGSSDCKIYLGEVLLYPEDVPPTPFSGKYKFTLTDDSVVSGECDSSSALTTTETSAYTSTLKEAVIGDCVTTIGANAFQGCGALSSITISSSVTSIESAACYSCYALSSVTIPDGVTSIGSNAFRYCGSLTSVTIGSGVTSIDNYAFRYCSGLTSVTIEATTPPTLGANVFGSTSDCPIYVPCSSVDAYKAANNWSTYASRIQGIPPCGEPQSAKFYAEYSNGDTERVECNSSSELIEDETKPMFSPYYLMTSAEIGDCVTTIGANAFQGCGALSSITISSSVTSIESAACHSCYALSSVIIPDGVTSIGYAAFNYCSGLTDVTIGSGVTSIGVLGFQSCTNLSSLTIPDSVTTIGQQAFEGCFALSSVTIGSGVTSIGGGAFGSCSALTSVTINATTPPTLGGSVFTDTNDCPIYVPCESVDTYKAASDWSTYADRIACVSPPIDYSTEHLSIVAETDNVTVTLYGGTSSNQFQYSLDSGTTWNSLQIGQTSPSINEGEKIMFKASGLSVGGETGIGTIRPSAAAIVEGNIMSLLYGDNFGGQTVIPSNFNLRKLFSGATNITSAENLVLPATTIKKQCYSQMFQGCTNLVTAPKVIGSSAMTWSGDYCWSDMFHGCTSLVNAPQLPATTLGTQCYWFMFQDCTSLETAPVLPAITLNNQCYTGMFNGCTKLNYIKAMFTTAPSTTYTNSWVLGVASSGTFVKNSAATWTTGCGVATYPCNWNVITE